MIKNNSCRITGVCLKSTSGGGAAQALVTNVTYEPFGPAHGYTLGNGQLVSRTYDLNGRLTDLVSPAFNEHVTRDVMGQISALGAGPGASPLTETYTRDALGRLAGVLDPSRTVLESLTFNPTGDRLSKTGSGLFTGIYTYAPGTHQLTGAGTAASSPDLNGNTTAISRAGLMDGFGYDDRNRLTVAQVAGGTVGTYVYNALGERISKTSGLVTTQFDYDENHRLLSEADAAGTPSASTRDYVQMNGIPVAVVDTSGGSSSIGYVTADQLGSPRAASNSLGSTEWLWPLAGNAWGELDPVSSGLVLNKRFPGQYYDEETGLSQNGFRDYDAGVGRYVQSDPMGLFGGQDSTYGYVNGMPLDGVDPYGLWSFSFEAYIGFGGGITFGQDPTTGQWFYGGRLGVGLSVGGSVDPSGKRPGAGQDHSDCGHGSTLGVFDQANFTAGLVGGNLVQADVGIDLDNSGNGYLDPPAPSDHLVLSRVGFSLGFSAGVEVFDH